MIENSNSIFQASDSESDAGIEAMNDERSIKPDDGQEDTNCNDLDSLKPKPVKQVIHNKGNPFKVSDNGVKRKSIKRKKDSDCGQDESDHEESDESGFKRFYEQMKEIIKNDNSDVEDEDLIKIAKQQFRQLDSNERKSWAKDKSTKRIAKSDNSNNKINGNKITNFFKRN